MSDITPPEPHPHSGDAHGILSKKIGPLSLGVYLIAFVVMLGVWYYWRSRKTPNPTPTTFTGDGTSATSSQDMAGASGGNVASPGSPASGSSATTLGAWLTNAANYLTGTGADPTAVQSALSAYGSGQQLTPAQQSLINQALSAEGSPPSGVIAANTQSQSISYTPVAGDTLTSIAQMFYGDSTRWHDIYAANQSVFGPNTNLSTPLHAGMTLTIPGNGLLPTPGPRDVYSGVPTGNKYTLAFGDTLIQLAERFYGDPNKWTAIAAANPKLIPDVNHPPIGTTIVIPNTAPTVNLPSAGSAIGL
jgi:nucleoid-associated protein YgaU